MRLRLTKNAIFKLKMQKTALFQYRLSPYSQSVTATYCQPPFGMLIKERAYSSDSYRFGFNGMEKVDEVSGEANNLDFGARIYNSRLCRFFTTDILTAKYPDFSPFIYAANTPVWLIDRDGKEPDRKHAGTIEQAVAQWAALKNPTFEDIKNYLQKDQAIRYVYTEKKGWIDLEHYLGVQVYGKFLMDALETASGSGTLMSLGFSPKAVDSYYSYEDLPSNQFSSEASNLTKTVKKCFAPHGIKLWTYEDEVEKTGTELIDAIKQNFAEAGAVSPVQAPNWKQIPFDYLERSRIPENKVTVNSTPIGNTVSITPYSDKEKKEFLKTGAYIPQNFSTKKYDLTDFPAANSSIEKGDKQVGNGGF